MADENHQPQTIEYRISEGEPLFAPKLKVIRAIEHIHNFHAEVRQFVDSKPIGIVRQIEPKSGDHIYAASFRQHVPPIWSCFIGDIAHNLRSSLDLLICALIEYNRGQVRRGSCFPIRRSEKVFLADGLTKVQGISPIAEKIVRRLKPYKGGNEALWVINELDRLDKHKSVIPVATMQSSIEVVGVGAEFLLPTDGRVTDGAELFRVPVASVIPDDEIPPEIHATVNISFGEGQILDGEPVIPTLMQLTNSVIKTLNIFERFAANHQP